MQFDHLTAEDGLSYNNITTIYQDRQGFIWIGTQEGLNRFDGYDFRIFKHDPSDPNSLSHSHITSIAEDDDGMLWIGTFHGGVNTFNPVTETFERVRLSSENGMPFSNKEIFTLFKDRESTIWVGGPPSTGLHRFHPDEGKKGELSKEITRIKAKYADPDRKERIGNWSVVEDREGNLWIAADFFLKKHNPRTHESILYPTAPGERRLRALYPGPDGQLWAGGTQGLYLFDMKTGDYTLYQPGYLIQVVAILADRNGALWISSDADGLFRFDVQSRRYVHQYKHSELAPEGLSSDLCSALFRDNGGIIWIGTVNGGINKLNLSKTQFTNIYHDPQNPKSLPHDHVTALVGDPGGNLWVGSEQTLSHMDSKSSEIRSFKLFPERRFQEALQCLLLDNAGQLWGSIEDSLIQFSNESLHVYQPAGPPQPHTPQPLIRALCRDAEGFIWVGVRHGGVFRFDGQTGVVTESYSEEILSTDIRMAAYRWIHTILQDKAGWLWLGTEQGVLARWNPKTHEMKVFSNDPDNPGGYYGFSVQTLLEDTSGKIWIGTSHGLIRFNAESETFTRFTEKNGLASSFVVGILEDDSGNLWLGTNHGISRFNPETESVRNFDTHDGLRGNEFSRACWKSPTGRMYFGGVKGIASFDPGKITDDPFKPPVVLTNVQLFNEPVSIGKHSILKQALWKTDQIALTHAQNNVTFEFSALSYASPQKNRYRYKLEGLFESWVDCDSKRRFATFTNLPPGDYVLRVQGTNHSGIWSDKEATLRIKVTPPWWKTWWAYTFYVLFLLAGGSSVYFYRINRLKKRQHELREEVARRTAEVMHQRDEIVRQKSAIESQAAELRVANEKLMELDGFKESMMGMIVHDLKNPLNAILSVVQSHSIRSEHELLKHSARQMLNLVQDILDVQKFEDAKIAPDSTDTSLRQLVDNAIRQVMFLVQQKSILLRNETAADIFVHVDGELIERVLVNLLTNSIKFTPNNGTITLVVANDISPSDGFVRVEVRDSGEGIPSDKLHLVFTKFGQARARKSGGVRSTGLGLTFCKLAVEAHGGQIGVTSEVGKGTTFRLTLRQAQGSMPSVAETLALPKPTDTSEAGVTGNVPAIALTEADRALVQPTAVRLKALKIYQYSQLQQVLAGLDHSQSQFVARWKKEVQQAIAVENETGFEELLNL